MTNEKLAEILNILSGLKKYDWNRVVQAVEMSFSEAQARLELDSASLKGNLETMFRGFLD